MIWVLAGTKDGREIIHRLLAKNYQVVASTATQYGSSLMGNRKRLKVISKRLSTEEMQQLIKEYQIEVLVDATHPYATEVSHNAMKACLNSRINYIRYERPSIQLDNYKGKNFTDIKEVALWLKDKKGNILLTTGSKSLEEYLEILDINRLIIRILPTSDVIDKCEKLGFKSNQIIAMEGPFSQQMNQVMYKHFTIKYMITKDSGHIGGTKEKVEGALSEGVTPIVIDRPKINYPNISHEINHLIEYIDKGWGYKVNE